MDTGKANTAVWGEDTSGKYRGEDNNYVGCRRNSNATIDVRSNKA